MSVRWYRSEKLVINDSVWSPFGATARQPPPARPVPAIHPAVVSRRAGRDPRPASARARSGRSALPAGFPRGLLFAAGLVTGEALMGILLAVPIALSGLWPTLGADPFQLFETPPLGGWPGLVVLAAVAVLLHRTATIRSR